MNLPPRHDLHDVLGAATQRLLGDALSLSDAAWLEPSLLPDWTRGHVGAHLSRNADALVRVVTSNLDGDPRPMYDSADERDADIEAGAGRSGLDQQVDLDTSASRLDSVLTSLPEDRLEESVEMRGGVWLPLGLIGVARLGEVVLHHVDLDTRFALSDAGPRALAWLLDYWTLRTRARDDFPALDLVAAESTWHTRDQSSGTRVEGEPAALLGWLTGRPSGAVSGAEGIELPPIA